MALSPLEPCVSGDPVQEGDDDESDDGESGGGDHGFSLSLFLSCSV